MNRFSGKVVLITGGATENNSRATVFVLIHHFRAHGGGAIVNTASLAGIAADPNMESDVGAKHGWWGRPRRRSSAKKRVLRVIPLGRYA